MKPNEFLSIGVSAYGNAKTTKHCLNAILNSLEGNFELILVDDCSPDNGEVFQLFVDFSKIHANTKIFKFDKNLEYSGSLNCILSHAKGEKIFFISNDIFTSESYFECLLNVANQNKDLGIVRGVSNFVDNGKSTHNINVSNEIKHYDDIAKYSRNLFLRLGNTFIEENYLTGDAFMVTRDLISKIGTIDPIFFGYFADHDFGIRALRSGYKLGVACGAFAYHHQDANFNYLPQEAKNLKLNARWSKIFENWARFKLKYGMPVSLPYTDINNIDWDSLNMVGNKSKTPYVEPVDYSKYIYIGSKDFS